MATEKLQNTFLSKYKDDFRDSDNYHRILFNSGRALQARELTQAQTLIQREIERFARYIFNEGSLLTSSLGNLSTAAYATRYIKLDTSLNPLPTNYNALVNTTVTNDAASPVTAIIRKVIPATGGDPATIMLDYVDGGSNTSQTTSIFQAGQTLTTDLGEVTIQSTDTAANPATGSGSMITVPRNEFFVAGHFVFTDQQTLVISKYNSKPSATVGYTVTEQIVSADDEVALYDNQGATPNLSSPGADRYRIRLTLTTEAASDATKTFVPIIKIENGETKLVQNDDNVLNRIGSTINKRTNDINGDFIVKDTQRFQLQIFEDSDDDYLIYSIQPGTAFVKGSRVEKTIPSNLRVKKPREDAIVDAKFVGTTISYGNYFVADSIHGMVSKLTMTKDGNPSTADIGIYSQRFTGTGAVLEANKIGTTKLRMIEEIEEQYNLHAFDIERDSNGSGTLFNVNDGLLLFADSNNYANLTKIEGERLINPGNNSALMRMPRDRLYDGGDATLTKPHLTATTTNGSGELTLSAEVGRHLYNNNYWMLAYDSGKVNYGFYNRVTFSNEWNNSQTATITGLAPSQNVTLLYFSRGPATVRAKTYVSNFSEDVTLTNGEATLSKVDLYKLNSITDLSTGESITFRFTWKLGQTANFYERGSIKIKKGVPVPSGQVRVNYDYFQHGAGDYFDATSYDITGDYSLIPTFSFPDGTPAPLNSALDFRPTKGTSGTFSGTGSYIPGLPRNRQLVDHVNPEFYSPRMDWIYMQPSGYIGVVSGEADNTYRKPELPNNAIHLHSVLLNPYTFNRNDLRAYTVDNRGYKMKDIRLLEKRIANVEELTTLTLLETSTQNLNVLDDEGNVRTKLGLTADAFKDKSFSDYMNNLVNNRSAIDRKERSLRPYEFRSLLPLFYDSDDADNVNVKRRGNLIMPVYEENVLINQNVASGYENVNQFSLSKYVGNATLIPHDDTWMERKTSTNGNVTVVVKDGDLSTHDQFQDYGNN